MIGASPSSATAPAPGATTSSVLSVVGGPRVYALLIADHVSVTVRVLSAMDLKVARFSAIETISCQYCVGRPTGAGAATAGAALILHVNFAAMQLL